MTFFSERTSWEITPNPFSQKIDELRAQNIPLIDLTVSNPTHCGFEYLRNNILLSFLRPSNLVYEPDPKGLMEARRAVLDYYGQKGISLEPDQIFLTANTSEAYTFIFRLLGNPGDVLAAPVPSYPLLDYLLRLNDLSSSPYRLRAGSRWAIEPDFFSRRPPDRLKALLTVNPNNPTGNYTREEEKKLLADYAARHHLALIADEVFYDFNFPFVKVPQSFAAEKEVLTFTLSGISKILGLPQMKLSWFVVTGPKTLREEAVARLEIIADTYLSQSTPIQNALPAWLSQKDLIRDEIQRRLVQNFQLVKDVLPKAETSRLQPEGGWNAVLKLPAGMRDEETAVRLAEENRVIVHPGYFFEFEEENFIVISLLVRPDIFKEGMEKLSGFLTA